MVDATAGVLANDSHPDEAEAYVGVEPEHGSLALAADGSFVYEPDENFVGTDTFTYLHVTERTAPLSGVVTIEVADGAPTMGATDDQVTTSEDTALDVDVLANDTQADGSTLAVESAGQPEHGSTAVVSGLIHYAPEADYHGSDEFTYTVCNLDGSVRHRPCAGNGRAGRGCPRHRGGRRDDSRGHL